jgi:hypothetical protein
MVQPFNYVIPQADPFAGVLQGLKLGATIQDMEAARAQQAMQMDAMRRKAALEQQAAQRAAANEAELRQLQAVPFEGMSRQQQLRLLQLTESEASRAFVARELERTPVEAVESGLRRAGSIVNALRMNPEIGIKLLRESAEVEKNPDKKKAYDDAASIAEQNPLLAARMIHGYMDSVAASNEKFRRVPDAVVNYLERVGSPLYPKEPGKPILVPPETTVLQDGKPIFTAPRKSQLLSPEEEAQKARIAAAGRTPPAPREPREPPAPTITQIQDPDDPERVLTVNARTYQGGGVGSPGVIGVSGKQGGAARAEMPNVSEQQASTATRRLLQRAKEINAAVQRTPKSEAPTIVEAGMENTPLLSRATNLVRSTDRQIVASAQDDVLDALLYLATGAAYNKEQLQQQKSAYLPVWSDEPATRAAKRQRLAQAIEGARVRAGRAWTPELEEELNKLLASPTMQSGGARPPAPAGGVDMNNPLLRPR